MNNKIGIDEEKTLIIEVEGYKFICKKTPQDTAELYALKESLKKWNTKEFGNGCRKTCPNSKCNSEDISASEYEVGASEISCIITCEKCGLKWWETYKAHSWGLL